MHKLLHAASLIPAKPTKPATLNGHAGFRCNLSSVQYDEDLDEGLDVVTTPITPALATSPSEERNQAPSILDRRRSSTRPSSSGNRSQSSSSLPRSRRGGRVGGAPIRVTMADIGAELTVRDGDTSSPETPFEDASEKTPQSTLQQAELSGTSGHTEDRARSKEVSGLGISSDGAADGLPSSVETLAVNGGAAKTAAAHSRQNTMETASNLVPQPHRRDRSVSPGRIPVRPSSPQKPIHGLSGDLTTPSLPPPSTAERAHAIEQRHLVSPPPHAAGLARKASSGISGLLGRMGSIRKTTRSPPGRTEGRFVRRDMGTSAISVDSIAAGLPSIQDEAESTEGSKKPSLQDQFQNVRRHEEFAMNDVDGHAVNDKGEPAPVIRTQSDVDVTSPTRSDESGERRMSRAASPPGPLVSPPLDPKLPPGTALGMAAGAPDEPRPVNWDLWQAVVYEGPAAVAKTSGDELKRAIASGIPAAIRGVVWQVLADSKSEELEAMYRTLKARGPDTEQTPQKPRPMSRSESSNVLQVEKDSTASSRSSVHSQEQDPSNPATSALTSLPPTVNGSATDVHAKLVAEKQKRETAAIAKLEKMIRRDMGSRTSYSKFTQSAGLQDGLFGVCKAYALFDEGVGYAQGINFIAMPLLFNSSEEEAFTLLVRLMSKYDLRSLFTADLAGLHLRLYQFERLLEDFEPALYCHLRRRNVGPHLYATQWFLTLFAYRFPLQLVLRVYDLVFSEGLTAILKFGIVLMQQNREALLEVKEMAALTNFLKEKLFDCYIDKSPSASNLLESGFFGSVTGGADKELYRADEMVRDACNIPISNETLASYTAEWEEQQRVERERTEELDTLRANTAVITLRIKSLEERTQQQDVEHVRIASDLVKVRVENDTLHDENEGLKMKVEELQKVVDAQPAEVESKLKEEMERIMQRNIEVQNENRGLREEMDEMEQALVQVKMAHAQTQSDHDKLRQKWSSVQALLNDS